jgi:hypothetical protein
MTIKKRIKNGFMLMELIVYIAVFTIFMYITTAIFTSVLAVQVESDTTSVVQQDARFITERLTYDIHRASSITTPNSAGEESSSLELLISGQVYTYALNNGNLEITDNNGTYSLNTDETIFSNLSFLRLGNIGGNHSIVVDFSLESTATRTSGAEKIDIHTAISTR